MSIRLRLRERSSRTKHGGRSYLSSLYFPSVKVPLCVTVLVACRRQPLNPSFTPLSRITAPFSPPPKEKPTHWFPISTPLITVGISSDWIKIVFLTPGYGQITQPILNALIDASRLVGKFTAVHATAYDTVRQTLLASGSQLHHSPVDRAVDDALVQRFLDGGQLICPTLTAMRAIACSNPYESYNYSAAAASVTALYKAQVPILAGSDAHGVAELPFQVAFGGSLHLELLLLVKAGLSAVDALRAATVLPAKYYGLKDRGSVEVGARADLVLVGCDPTMDITCSKDIKRIWIAGVEHEVDTGRAGLRSLNLPTGGGI